MKFIIGALIAISLLVIAPCLRLSSILSREEEQEVSEV